MGTLRKIFMNKVPGWVWMTYSLRVLHGILSRTSWSWRPQNQWKVKPSSVNTQAIRKRVVFMIHLSLNLKFYLLRIKLKTHIINGSPTAICSLNYRNFGSQRSWHFTWINMDGIYQWHFYFTLVLTSRFMLQTVCHISNIYYQ